MELYRGELLLDFIRSSGYTVSELAAAEGMDRSTLYRKIKNPQEYFTCKEADKLRKLIGMSRADFDRIFYS